MVLFKPQAGLLIAAIGALILACSHLHKQARESLEGGAYLEALATYDEILAKRPSDSEALQGRAHARRRWMDSQLLAVRLARLSGNRERSLDLLLGVLRNENAWATFPASAVLSTQQSELEEGRKAVRDQVKEAVQAHLPLLADFKLTRFKPLFDGRHAKEAQALVREIHLEGRSICAVSWAQAALSLPYYTDFAAAFCRHFGRPRDGQAMLRVKRRRLYHGITLASSIDGVPKTLLPELQESLTPELTSTPWFDSGGRLVLPISLTGSFVQVNRDTPEQRVHEYLVSVPYIAMERRLQTRQITYQEPEPCSSASYGLACSTNAVTSERTETTWENVPVTRYQEEPRVQSYGGTNKYQLLGLAIEGQIQLLQETRMLHLSEKDEQVQFEHHWNLPAIGLVEHTANLPDPARWLTEQATQLGKKLKEQLEQAWKALYCKAPDAQSSAALVGEAVQRCLALDQDAPPFVLAWYQAQVGLLPQQTKELLGH